MLPSEFPAHIFFMQNVWARGWVWGPWAALRQIFKAAVFGFETQTHRMIHNVNPVHAWQLQVFFFFSTDKIQTAARLQHSTCVSVLQCWGSSGGRAGRVVMVLGVMGQMKRIFECLCKFFLFLSCIQSFVVKLNHPLLCVRVFMQVNHCMTPVNKLALSPCVDSSVFTVQEFCKKNHEPIGDGPLYER